MCTCRGRNVHSVHYGHLCLTITPISDGKDNLTHPYGPQSCPPNTLCYSAHDEGSHASYAMSSGRVGHGLSPDQYLVDGIPRPQREDQIQQDARARTYLMPHGLVSRTISEALKALGTYLRGSLARVLNFAGSTNTAVRVHASASLPRVRSE